MRIGSAAAEVPTDRAGNIVVGWIRGLVQQRPQAHDLAGCAVAALEGILLDKRLLDRIELGTLRQALERADLLALAVDGEREAGVDRAPIQGNGARATVPHVADLLGTGQAKVVP